MSVVGEAALSAFFQIIFDRLAPKHVFDFIRERNMEKEVEKLEKTLFLVKAVLNDAEEKQMKDFQVKAWLDDLKDVAHDAEDALDEFATEALQWKLCLEKESQASSNQLWNMITDSFKPIVTLFNDDNDEIKSRINDITERLDDLAKKRVFLGLKEVAAVASSNKLVFRETSSLVHESQVHGRDEEKKKIVEQLLKGSENDEFAVIPILGMGGVGKTTLAQFVYNDTEVKKHFDLKAWVCVADDFDVKVITSKLLEAVTGGSCDFNNLDVLQAKLQQQLTSKKFLIVLDDVWSENRGNWIKLRAPLIGGALGSKVIVTTRIRRVAKMMGTVEPHFLKQLSEDECWSVFEQHAFKNGNVDRNLNLVAIGKKIVEKCKGLPLAARTLGGLLRSKQYETEWKCILNSEIWDLTEEESDILPALRLSYYHLPSYLKQCFSYCSIFPKDYEFGEEEIVLLWMAQGFLQRSGEKKMEDLGKKYFEDLKSRSFFQPSNSEKSLYVMHDLINDLAQWVARETCFRLGDGQHPKQYKDSKRVRHSSYVVGECDGEKKFMCFHEFQCLRTFLPFKLSYYSRCYLTRNVPLYLLPKLKCLRALSLSGYYIVELPNSIGDLKLLRYLDVSNSQIRRLPETVSSLYNLETLILEGCSQLRKLPEDFANLINLRHLNNLYANSLEEMPRQISKLTCLQTLPNFVVGKGSNGSSLSEIRPLSYLQGALCISGLENVVEVGDAGKANLIGKQDLHELLMKWNENFGDSRNGKTEFEVFNMLQPHITLKELTIECYAGAKFPTWLGDPSFSNMVLLKIENCEKCTSLPPLGQLPSLKDLSIKKMPGVKSVGFEFYGNGSSKPFQSLDRLCFEKMQEWQDWIPRGEFLCLRELSISQCPNLRGKLPNLFPSLEEIFIDGCEQLVVSISNFPMLCNFNINGCKEAVHESIDGSSSLNYVSLSAISELTSLTEGFMHGIGKVKHLEINSCEELTSLWQDKDKVGNSSIASEQEENEQLGVPCRLEKLPQALHSLTLLEKLEIINCPRLISLPNTGLPLMLKELIVKNCRSLEKLPHALHSLTSLGKLMIEKCPRLNTFPDAGLPSTLRELIVNSCGALNSLLHEANMCNEAAFLERLEIEGCESLTFIMKGHLPPTLKRLGIYYCNNLQCVVDEGEGEGKGKGSPSSLSINKEIIKSNNNNNNASLLEFLSIRDCPSLKSFSSSTGELGSLSLPTALKFLLIEDCPMLESIVGDRWDNNSSLEHLKIWSCEKLKYLPEGLHNLCHLNEISLIGCSSLVSFPNGLLPTSLRELRVSNCMELEVALPNPVYNLTSLELMGLDWDRGIYKSFMEKGFPSSLIKLEISVINICKPLLEEGLYGLTSLTHLHIIGGWEGKVYDEKMVTMKLPTSLTDLEIEDFEELEILSVFQGVPALKLLNIWYCPKFKSLPEKDLLLSLLQLQSVNCPLLQPVF